MLYQERHIILSLWYELAIILNSKMENKIYKPGKDNDSIRILQLDTIWTYDFENF